MANKTTFWNYINNNNIEIPIIQRDYAQGRLGKEHLRQNFLTNIKDALDNNKILKLDFVYGSKEEDKLYPLDGQQRLTTLWLLHWYVALRAGYLYRACPILKKFSYETRITSRDFCEQLCKPKNFESYTVDQRIVHYMTNQTWFYSTWKQDPTIQSMLRMLSGSKINDKNGEDIIDGIEEIFQNTKQPQFNRYWLSLCSDKSPIEFYHLALKDFGLSDDLYIKMNARGKQLTAFENFKADLIGFIREQGEHMSYATPNDWKPLLNPNDGIPILMDTKWTDIFWKNKSVGVMDENKIIRNADQIDEIFFAFINRFFWNELFVSKDANGNYILDVGDGFLKNGKKTPTIENDNPSYHHLNEDRYEFYTDFSPYMFYKEHKDIENEPKIIPLSLFKDLKTILNNFVKYQGPIPCKWNKSFQFIPVYDKYDKDKKSYNIEIENNDKEHILKISSLNQIQRIVFFAVCKYFKEEEGEADPKSLKRWMRVVWNLVSGEGEDGRTQIRNTDAMRKCIEFIDRLDSHNVYVSLQWFPSSLIPESEFGKRCKEEKIKARWILFTKDYIQFSKDKSWEDVIIEAEEYAFFKGAIRFLYQDAKGNVNWDDFNTKWENVKRFFDADGVKQHYSLNARLLRCFLTKNQDFPKDFWFGNGSHFWLSVLLSDSYRMQVNDLLKGRLSTDSSNDWVANDMLLGCIIEKENWHILDDWRGYDVLTRYTNRQSGKVNSPRQIIVLDHRRNEVLTNVHGITIRDENRIEGCDNYFFGWDVDFKYSYNGKDFFFRWNGEPSEKELDVYLMENNWVNRKLRADNIIHKGTDEDYYYCFRYYYCQGKCVRYNTFTCFERNLKRLINEAT